MTTNDSLDEVTQAIVDRALRRYEGWRRQVHERTDRGFAKLLAVEWIAGIVFALVISPYAWEGRERTLHQHVFLAAGLGAMIVSLPIFLAWKRPGEAVTRHVIAAAQMMMSALFIHLTGGRIETHFHIFGSLAFLSFYLDWKVIVTAIAVTVADHFFRGIYYPESIYGVLLPDEFRFLEHGAWVLFCGFFLVRHANKTSKAWLTFAEEGGMLEAISEVEWRERSVLEREAMERAKAEGA
jgi:hypothetical protein